MIDRVVVVIMMLLCISCENRVYLKTPALLSYSNSDVSVDIELVSRKKINLSGKKGDWNYFYYGTFTSQVKDLHKDPKEIRLLHNKEESKIYLDSIADVNFWSSNWWDSNGFRKNKIYVVFDDPDIHWSKVKLIEVDIPKSMTHEEVCKMLKRNSSQSHEGLCNQQSR